MELTLPQAYLMLIGATERNKAQSEAIRKAPSLGSDANKTQDENHESTGDAEYDKMKRQLLGMGGNGI